MSQYTKLFNSILDSTVWLESKETRLVWVTLLAMSDRDGLVEASVPGLAKRSGVSVAECYAALAVLVAPDPYSRTKGDEGRRLRDVANGGWLVINREAYAERMSSDDVRQRASARQQRYRLRKKAKENAAALRPNVYSDAYVTSRDVTASTSIDNNDSRVEKSREEKREGDQTRASAETTPVARARVADRFAESLKPATSVDSWDGPVLEHRERADNAKLDLLAEAEKFRLKSRSAGKMVCDWDAEFSHWLLRAIQFRRQDQERDAARSGASVVALAPKPRTTEQDAAAKRSADKAVADAKANMLKRHAAMGVKS